MPPATLPSNDDSTCDLIVPLADEVSVGPTCDKCGANIDTQDALVCRRCGWYASIGSYVEIDQAWEGVDQLPDQEPEAIKMPAWGWTMIACVAAVLAESIAARVLTVDGSVARTTWSVAQLFLGLTVAFTCHLTAFVLFMREVSEAGLLDIILKPVKPWILRVHELPASQWICHAGISAVVATVMAVVVIGGIPYEKLWDWGFEKPVKQNLMGAIMDQARKGEGEEKPLEEAVQEFAGQTDGDDAKEPSKLKASTEPKERQHDDCLIIGYRANSEGLVYLLLLAGEHFGKLQYVGQVTPQMSVKELRELSDNLAAHQTFAPFVSLPMDGVTWVKPKFTCRVSYGRKGKKGGLYDVKLESFLGEIGTADNPTEPPTTGNVPTATDNS